MKTLDQANYCKRITESLLRINQESYIRDENNLKPIGVKWDLEKQSDFFIGLKDLRDNLDFIIESLGKL